MQNRTFYFMELAPIKGQIPSEQLNVEKVITCDWDTMIQSKQYDQGHPSWKPFEAGQTVWLARPKKWKFGKKWIGPYKICSQNGVNLWEPEKMGKK